MENDKQKAAVELLEELKLKRGNTGEEYHAADTAYKEAAAKILTKMAKDNPKAASDILAEMPSYAEADTLTAMSQSDAEHAANILFLLSLNENQYNLPFVLIIMSVQDNAKEAAKILTIMAKDNPKAGAKLIAATAGYAGYYEQKAAAKIVDEMSRVGIEK